MIALTAPKHYQYRHIATKEVLAFVLDEFNKIGEQNDKSIEMLDNEARDKAIRIKELRKLLEG